MTKIYVVTRVMTENGIETRRVNSIFTNSKKAQSLVRFYNALDEMDKKKYPNIYKSLNPKTKIETFNIDNFDYTNAAIEKELENLNK